MTNNTVDTKDRFTRQRPCPVCGGNAYDERGQGRRCYGYYSSQKPDYVYCSREEYSHGCDYSSSAQVYRHRLGAECKCGVTHLLTAIPTQKLQATKPMNNYNNNHNGNGNGHHTTLSRAVIEAEYRYDVPGQPVFWVRRQKLENGSKSFVQGYYINGGKEWKSGRPEGVEGGLYNVLEVIAAPPDKDIYIVEGEKKVEALKGLGLVATCNVSGAGKWKPELYNQYFKDKKRVIILADNDPETDAAGNPHRKGQKHAEQVKDALLPIVGEIRILTVSDRPKGDIVDFLQDGGTKEQLLAMVEEAESFSKTLKQQHLSEQGNARRLVERFGQDMRYVEEWGWVIWDGKRWQIDRTGAAERRAKKTVQSIYTEAGQIEDDDKRKATVAWAIKSESKAKIEATLGLAKSELEVRSTPERFDRDPMLLNCQNGTVDLRTGKLRPHNRKDLLTKIIATDYDPEAKCPTWLQFLNRIMAGNSELIAFIQRALGYTLTGDISEHVMPFCYGTGANGKSTMLDVIATILADYYRACDFSTLLDNNNKNNGGANPEIARLAGARFVAASEPEPGKRLAVSTIKQLTGGERITARMLYKNNFEFTPEFKLWIAANHKPQVRGQDEGIWRRILLIPFMVTIPPEERDKKLKQKLLAEGPGILAWMVEGCLEWQAHGLKAPAEVMAATEAYKSESDIIGDFIKECCVKGSARRIEVARLYKAYVNWCEESAERPIGKKNFTASLAERGIISRTGNGNKQTYFGIDLLTDANGAVNTGEQYDGFEGFEA